MPRMKAHWVKRHWNGSGTKAMAEIAHHLVARSGDVLFLEAPAPEGHRPKPVLGDDDERPDERVPHLPSA
jgi:hypothetical protein